MGGLRHWQLYFVSRFGDLGVRERGFGAEKVSGWMDASKSGRKKIIKGGLVIRLLITDIMSQNLYCATLRIYSYGNTYIIIKKGK